MIIFAVFVSGLILGSVFLGLLNHSSDPKPFYVGVTYCAGSAEEAKLLIDRVKNYTNLFVLQSGGLQRYPDVINEIGDYAVSSGMYFIISFGSQSQTMLESWLETNEGRWGDKFLGVYFGDEPAGKSLDGHMSVSYDSLGNSINFGEGMINQTEMDHRVTKSPGRVDVMYKNMTTISFLVDGTVYVDYPDDCVLDYSPDGSVKKLSYPNYTEVPVGSSDVPPYEELLDINPLQTYQDVTDFFIDAHQDRLACPKNNFLQTLTSDYVLYWFDYKAGYDVLLAQVGWNHTLAQDIALVRGSATLHNKPWGTILTWKYNHTPYLDSGEAIYNQMRTAYEAGAEYVVVFNYAEDMTGPYGTLQDEHFDALERFWNEVVQSSSVNHGSVEAEAVLVLPESYGWGMRDLEDKIWGLWGPDENSHQIWILCQSLLDQYGLGLDIVYSDPEFVVEGKYPQVYYWNQTG
ncbi:MAG: hypothetical protein PVI43_01860 [Candidatus Bathyarchaeota archaeon]